MEQKDRFEYQEELNLCVNRLKEVFPKAKIEKLDNVAIMPVKRFDQSPPVEYDKETNTLYYDQGKMKKTENRENAIMHGILEVVTTNDKKTRQGVAFQGKMKTVNQGVTDLIANLLIPSETENGALFISRTVANLFTNMIGADLVFDAYFNAEGEKMYDALVTKLNHDKAFVDEILEISEIERKTVEMKDEPSLLGYLQDSVAQTYFKSNDLTIEEKKSFHDAMITDPRLGPLSTFERLKSCTGCDEFVNKDIAKMELSLKEQEMRNSREQELEEMFEENRERKTEKVNKESIK